MNRTSHARFRSAAAIVLGLTAGGVFARPAQGDVVFAPAELYPLGNTPIGVTVADVDGDGVLDVISANGDLSLLVNNGDGTLATEVRLGTGGGGPRNVAVGDLDGDGDADLVASIQSGPGTIAVFLAESAGVFAPAVQYGAPRFAFVLVMTDLDGDEDLDVAVVFATGFGVGVSVLHNAGDGTFLSGEAYDVFEAPVVYTADLAAADVNGDDRPDLVVVNDCPVGCDASIAIMINAGDGTFLPPVPLDLGVAIAAAVRADDLDGDGDADLAIVECVVSGSDLVIAVNDGAGAFSVLSRSPTGRLCSAGSVTTPDGIAFLDVDTDGAPDAVLPSMIDDEVRVLLNRGDLTFDAPIALAVGDRPIAVAAGDLDGDGRDDVVTADRAVGGVPTVTVLINQTPVIPGDLDGDGTVGVLDFFALLAAWGPCPEPCPPQCVADLNMNCTVDVIDFFLLLANWG
jgi:hypothetical protein